MAHVLDTRLCHALLTISPNHRVHSWMNVNGTHEENHSWPSSGESQVAAHEWLLCGDHRVLVCRARLNACWPHPINHLLQALIPSRVPHTLTTSNVRYRVAREWTTLNQNYTEDKTDHVHFEVPCPEYSWYNRRSVNYSTQLKIRDMHCIVEAEKTITYNVQEYM